MLIYAAGIAFACPSSPPLLSHCLAVALFPISSLILMSFQKAWSAKKNCACRSHTHSRKVKHLRAASSENCALDPRIITCRITRPLHVHTSTHMHKPHHKTTGVSEADVDADDDDNYDGNCSYGSKEGKGSSGERDFVCSCTQFCRRSSVTA